MSVFRHVSIGSDHLGPLCKHCTIEKGGSGPSHPAAKWGPIYCSSSHSWETQRLSDWPRTFRHLKGNRAASVFCRALSESPKGHCLVTAWQR